MTDPTDSPACPTPRCPRCGAPLVRAATPPGAFGLAGEACYECDDASPARPTPWACPACGGMWLLDAGARDARG